MAHYYAQPDNPSCHDSFLDVVTNIVGILIILVVVAGLRAKNAPVHASMLDEPPSSPGQADLRNDLAAEQALRHDILHTAEQIRALGQESLARFHERDQMATLVSFLEHKIQSHRDQLDAKARREFELVQSLSEARHRLDQLERQRIALERSEPESVVIQSLPTPLSKTVDSQEVHFQLRAGRVSYIPLEKLLEQFKADALRHMHKLLEVPEFTETVGPEGGFRLRYTIQRCDVSVETQLKTGRGAYAQLKHWTLIPISSQLGEPLERALAEGSSFRQTVAALKPGKTTITLWVYPDSFDQYRALRQELYRQGFAVAGRPLPEGVPIGGAPQGSKSAAE